MAKTELAARFLLSGVRRAIFVPGAEEIAPLVSGL
jgi:hypothetical protein